MSSIYPIRTRKILLGELETIKDNQTEILELKTIITEIMNAVHDFYSRP